MKDKINIAELLKDCPTGMELDCINYNGIVTFEEIINSPDYPIVISIKYNDECCKHTLTKYGQTCKTPYNKCIIFPKGKTTWKDFEPLVQFKDGDIVSTSGGHYTFILKGEAIKKESYYTGNVYFGYRADTDYIMNNNIAWHFSRLATEEEKQKLFDAIKANGYKWNAETKTLDKLIDSQFKDGDIIFTHANCLKVGLGNTWISIFQEKRNGGFATYVDYNEEGDAYYDNTDGDKPLLCMEKDVLRQRFATEEEKAKLFKTINDKGYKWNEKSKTLEKLIVPKFDITTLKPFDKVLVRDNNKQRWSIDLFSFVDNKRIYSFVCIGHYADQCIPYEGNEHLLGTTNDCDNYYKTWK